MHEPAARAVTGNVIYNYFSHPCGYRVHLDLHGDRTRRDAPGPAGRYLMERGNRHEAAVFAGIRARDPEDWRAIEADPTLDREADIARRIEATLDAMREGVRFIFHGFLTTLPGEVVESRPGGEERESPLVFRGETDLLVRVEEPSAAFGAWSYQVGDVKSSRRARFAQKMQVAFYSWILERRQGVLPREGFVVTGEGRRERFELEECIWTLRHFLEEEIHEYARAEDVFYQIEPACGQCHWRSHCAARAADDDDLSLVPGMRRADKRTLLAAGIPSRGVLREQDDATLRALGRSFGRKLDGFRDLKQRASAQDFGRALVRQAPPAEPGARRPRTPDLFHHRGPLLLVASVPDFYDGQEAVVATALLRREGRRLEGSAGEDRLTFLRQDPDCERLHLFGQFLQHKDEIDRLLARRRERALPVFLDRRAAWRMRRNAESARHAQVLQRAERLVSDAVVLPEVVERHLYLPRAPQCALDLAAAVAAGPPPAGGVFAEGPLEAFLGAEEATAIRARIDALAADYGLDAEALRGPDEDLRAIWVKEWRAGGDEAWARLLEFELGREIAAGRSVLERLLEWVK
ncbi:MAG: TM0106 family RecB-like putative nuclease [Planctomycetota bacterium]